MLSRMKTWHARSDDVYDAVMILNNNKAWGLDHITGEHLKNASKRLGPCVCFTVAVVPGVVPHFFISRPVN